MVGERAQERLGGDRGPFAPVGVTAMRFAPYGVRLSADAVVGFWLFYATGEGLTTEGRTYSAATRNSAWPVDLGQAFGEAFALRIDQSGGARAGDGVGGAFRRDGARQRRADHPRLDGAVVGKPARMRVAIAFDQPGAFGDFERRVRRECRAASAIRPSQDSICACSCLKR